jgi:hypothetical protein
MPRGHENDWPPDKEVGALIAELGVPKAAERLDVSTATLRSHAQRKKLPTKKVDKAKVTAAPAPAGEAEVSEVEMLRHRVAELESVERKDRKNKVYDERIVAAVEAEVATRKPRYSPAVIPKSKHSATQHEFFLNWSDLHAGEVVSLEETGGINSYDWDTMLVRQERLREGLFSYQDNRPYPVQTLRVGALGDMLSGSIHDELVATNEIPMAAATVQLAQDGAEWLESLTERFPHVHFSGVVGNHPRAHKKPWAKQGYDNADWTVYRIMEAILAKNPAITFDIPKSTQHRIIVAEKWPLLLWHGDGVRSSMPGVPWGGVTRRVTALKAQYAAAGKPVQFFNCGHFHVACAVEGGTIILNGSVKGVDEYSIKAFGGGRPAQQVLQTFHPRKGLTDVSMIDLQ